MSTEPDDKKIEDYLAHRTRVERLFLESEDGNAIINKHGVFAYQSVDGNHIIALDSFLADYREWLIKRRFLKEI